MRMKTAALLALVTVLATAALAAPAGAEPASAAAKSCATPAGFRGGPFFVDRLRARGVSCRAARRLVKRWGRTDDCMMPSGPSDRVCHVGSYRCVYRDAGYESFRTTCKSGRSKAVGFRAGS
jgi:hypothetical protein